MSVAPAALTLQSRVEPRQQTFVLSSSDRPIRVLRVDGPLLASPAVLPRDSRATLVVDLALDMRRCAVTAARVKSRSIPIIPTSRTFP